MSAIFPRFTTLFSLLALGALAIGQANAGVVVSLVGDKDGFGLTGAPAVPADGTLWQTDLGGSFFNDYRDALDVATAPFTDKWSSDAAVTYVHSYDLAGQTPLSAVLSVQFAGVADQRGPWDVFFDGVLLGQIPTSMDASAFEMVRMLSWNVPVGLLTGSDTILLNINVPETTDGYSINFSELQIETADAGVPDSGSTLALFGFGLAGLVLLKRRLARA